MWKCRVIVIKRQGAEEAKKEFQQERKEFEQKEQEFEQKQRLAVLNLQKRGFSNTEIAEIMEITTDEVLRLTKDIS